MNSDEQTPQFFSTFDVAKLVGVDIATVIDWCQQGKLAAFKTPGGHRRIKPADLISFLTEFKMPVPASLIPLGNLKCVVVDDEPGLRKVITRIIKSIDPKADVVQAQNGFEAGTKVLETLPHLVVLDIMLPGMNGFDVCKHIRNDARFKRTKILAISGDVALDVKKKILACGADDFLPKPFTPKDLKEALTKLLPQ